MQISGKIAVRAEPTTASPLVQRLGSSLGSTVWRLQRRELAARAIVLIEDGGARLEAEAQTTEVGAGSLCWLVEPQFWRLAARAGTTGFIAEIPEDGVTRAAGDFAGSPMLGLALEHDLILRTDTEGRGPVAASLAAIAVETQVPRVGSGMVIAAQLRILLVAILRLSGLGDAEPHGAGAGARFLQHFRQLVEANFRAHWPIARYAGVIGISHDRLHGICMRVLGRTPKALVAERLAREAGLGLEHSSLSIEQLSYALGFRDPAHFSHFFKRMTGIAPGAFRRRMVDSARDSRQASPANFADWP